MAVDRLELIPLTTITDSTTYDLADYGYPALGEYVVDCRFVLDVQAAATDAGDLMDVYVQSSYNKNDPDPIWDDFVSFTQILGNGGAKQEIMSWNRAPTPESEQRTPSDGSLTAASVLQGPVGRDWRVKIDITDAGTNNASFDFRLVGDAMFYK